MAQCSQPSRSMCGGSADACVGFRVYIMKSAMFTIVPQSPTERPLHVSAFVVQHDRLKRVFDYDALVKTW